MYVTTTQLVMSAAVIATWLELLTDGVGAAGDLSASYIGYYVNDVTPTPGDAYADYTLTDLDGAGPVYALTWTSSVNIGVQKKALLTSHTVIVDPVPDPEVTVYGFIITNVTPDAFYGAYRFPTPMTIQTVGQFISVDIALVVPEVLQTGLS